MKFEPTKIRNFVVAGHSGCGKTTLCDRMLYKAKAVDRLGSVDSKTSVSDFTPDEQEQLVELSRTFTKNLAMLVNRETED